MLENELQECEEILSEIDEEVYGVMVDLDICEDDARGVLQAVALESAAKEFFNENPLAITVR